eukprot:scaffold15718_cov1332-Ochromonas_danica.AAC.1
MSDDHANEVSEGWRGELSEKVEDILIVLIKANEGEAEDDHINGLFRVELRDGLSQEGPVIFEIASKALDIVDFNHSIT